MSYILYDPEAPVITPRKPKRDCTKIVLTDEQQQWLRDHFATTLNKDCAAHLGISESSVLRWARQLGLTKDPDWFHALVMERVRMMAAVNRGPGNHGKKNLLIYGQPHHFRKGQTNRERYGEENERRRIQRAAGTRRETMRKERMRIRWGLPQETKLRVISNRKATYIRHSLKRAGYILQGRCAWEAYYTIDTHRIPSLEQSAQQNGIKITSLFSGRLAETKQAQ
jgi:hypothetical protein